MDKIKPTIGIYGLGSQSGRAFFADLIDRGYPVIGYNRSSSNGISVVEAINRAGGITLQRPENNNNECTHFVPLDGSVASTDLKILVDESDYIIIALPSIYQVEAAQAIYAIKLKNQRPPLILSPSRTFASPYIWKCMGEGYPIICLSTCPYSCKAPQPDTSLIKRRKRTFNISLEGDFSRRQKDELRQLFPQAAISKVPALTSLNNIGAVFHCATYLLNIDEIERRNAAGEIFSFYIDGIAKRPDVGEVLESIDQIRLKIAQKIGFSTFGLIENPREDVWRKLTNGLRALEEEHEGEIDVLRELRRLFNEYLNTSIISAQHWLDITYGVTRIEGERLSDAIGRTPTYQKNSVPQRRYITEDIPTGLVPFEALAKMLDIDCKPVTAIIDKYNERFNTDIRQNGRNLRDFDFDYIISYLKGEI